MNKLPEKNRVFRLKGDLSQFKIDENGQFFVWMRHEHCWCNPFVLKKKMKSELKLQMVSGITSSDGKMNLL